MNGFRPSERLRAALRGHAQLKSAPQDWLSFIIYQRAAHVLCGGSLEGRRARLAEVEPAIRHLVEAEATRMWNNRRGG